ncbi:MAG: alpha-amylase, partial [Anaerolineales bacterium]|nr:alpha-amylase [Anaerolineales bacterium]
WVIEHPDWFISLNYSPFPGYTFNGPNLSHNERVGIYLEDHYYNRSDAAVVFKRVDHWTGDTRYIYHGNDGTSMPWNDTAQLDYLLAEVREAVIQTILHVARKFPIIRFDAAMTLAKKHYQRLWFPVPGSGGDIPSRADFGLTREQFDAAFPQEFWREVVDRVAQEVPDTLLLAEAFWMMEGYFVRTLGMHRVYNSAFMHMLRDERNAEYRQLIKNTLEFDPQILKRYVNFMNNPDEETAIAQFGKDDKYFGVTTLMATLPGLPMFGHGQVEGYYEKYGMEYRRAYWEESPDPDLVSRHERAIFPLLHRRYLFAEVENFLLYDFYNTDGQVNEDVIAYSNRHGDQRGLVIYHNRWAETRGWIKTSAAYLDKYRPDAGLVQRDIAAGLDLSTDPNTFTIFRDHVNGLQYIRSNQQIYEQGLYIELSAYKHQVFLDFRQVQDNEWGQYRQLYHYLDGRGVPDIYEALQEIILQPLHYPFRELVNPGMFQWLLDNRSQEAGYSREMLAQVLQESEQKMERFLLVVDEMLDCEFDLARLVEEISAELDIVLHLDDLSERYPKLADPLQAIAAVIEPESEDLSLWSTTLAYVFTHKLGKAVCEADYAARSNSLIREWLLHKIILQTMQQLGLSSGGAQQALAGLMLMVTYQDWATDLTGSAGEAGQVLEQLLTDQAVQQFIGTNRYQGVLWFNKESFDMLLRLLLTASSLNTLANKRLKTPGKSKALEIQRSVISKLGRTAGSTGYQLEKLLQALVA